jgi:hypothetical protein
MPETVAQGGVKMRSFLKWLSTKLPSPQIIYDRNVFSPYLSRWYLLGAPRMPDKSWVFDKNGVPKEGAMWNKQSIGIYLHRFHRDDDELELHNHPWRWAVSIVLVGGYIEERRGKNDVVRVRIVRPWRINFIRAEDFHRVDLIEQDAWTLFFVGPKFTGWGFWNRDTKKFLPWRQFISQLRDPTAFAREK